LKSAVFRAVTPVAHWLLLALTFVLAGCSISGNPYAVHPETITALRSQTGRTVRLAPFTSDKPGKSEIMCRLVGMIQTPGGVPFERYVEDAFRTDLVIAGLESPTAPVTLSGHLERMHFTTGTEAVWDIELALASSNGRRLRIVENYAFNWHYLADYACREAATAMSVAVQALVRRAVQHPEFAALLTPGSAAPTVTAPAQATTPITPPTSPATPAPATTASIPPTNLRDWAPGKWRSTGGTNRLVIDGALRWSWESSVGGKWTGSGLGEIQGGRLILRGWHSTSIPMTLRLVREGEALVGELHTSRQYTIIFTRE
jgi:hypothetical protein